MEEAEAMARLRDLLRAADPALTERQAILAIAAMIQRSDAYVRMRLHWVDRLGAAAKSALRDGDISKEMARNLVIADEGMQEEAVAQILDGYITDADDLREMLTQDMPSFGWAVFDRADYDGETVEDPDNPDQGWFKDVELAMRLQRKGIEDLTARLEREYDWVELLTADRIFQPHLYRDHKTDDGDEAPRGAVIDIVNGLGVTIHESLARKPSHPNYRPPQNEATNGGANAVRMDDHDDHAPAMMQPRKASPDPCTKAHLAHARRRKSMALQQAVCHDDRAALALACLALMGHQSCCRIEPGQIGADDTALHPAVGEELGKFRDLYGPKTPGTGAHFEPPKPDDRMPMMLANRGWGQDQDDNPGAAALLRDLLATQTDELQRLFRLLVARQTGSFVTGEAGDYGTVLALAHHLGMDDGREGYNGLTLTPDDLDGLRANALEATARAVREQPGKTTKETRDKIIKALRDPVQADVVLPTLRFTDPASAMNAMILMATGEDPADREAGE